MAVPVLVALRRGRPQGLTSARATDLLWGIALGAALRLVQGWLSGANQNQFPTVAGLDGTGANLEWFLGTAVPGTLVSPILEEFYFRAVILVGVYQILRRSVGTVGAAITALLASSGFFVVLHQFFSAITLADGVQLFLVGATCGLLVFLTGRIWGAILVHVVYNGIYFCLAILGSGFAS
jgi:membrane protease YdiL (CAAX protease family)